MPDHYPTLFNLALSLRRAGRDDAAVEAFTRATAVDGQEPDAWLALGDSLRRLGREEAAGDALRRYVALAPPSAQRSKVEAMLKGTPSSLSAPTARR
jgi:Flp pilus assembly protein TadD